ncbi:hypothetical protein HLB23_27080 [Nocardia uniformis]|uniref:Uncharacterized protein n=1 Tax=Nocardia uniformis TaxID=53432 RepID=A0A849C6W0_9NOCA|nr:hypothetical protein [Nocardia uniformis]NNH73476.1 hypothetical protein [Nocardia uniformis]
MTKFLATLSGLLLAAAVALIEPWMTIPVLIFVIAGWRWRICAVAAVLTALGVLAWLDTTALIAGATGLVATTYLLNAATVSAPLGVVPTTIPSVAGALVFTIAAGAASVLPVTLAWAPIAAPIVVIVLYAWLVHGLADRRPEYSPVR